MCSAVFACSAWDVVDVVLLDVRPGMSAWHVGLACRLSPALALLFSGDSTSPTRGIRPYAPQIPAVDAHREDRDGLSLFS